MNNDIDKPFLVPALVTIEWSVLRPSLVSRVDPRQRRHEQRHADVNRLHAARLINHDDLILPPQAAIVGQTSE
jgi:hypothetical protein